MKGLMATRRLSAKLGKSYENPSWDCKRQIYSTSKAVLQLSTRKKPMRNFVGHNVTRIEDAALLKGLGRFVDDVEVPNLLHASFVRSPHAHAIIQNIEIEAAAETCREFALFLRWTIWPG